MTIRYAVCRDSDGRYVGSVPNLPGCVAQAETEDELEIQMAAAADLYVRIIRERHLNVPEFLEIKELEVG